MIVLQALATYLEQVNPSWWQAATLGFASNAKENVGIDHFCIGIEDFDPEKARRILAAQSIETFTELGTGVFFRDADGNKVQVSAPNYPD